MLKFQYDLQLLIIVDEIRYALKETSLKNAKKNEFIQKLQKEEKKIKNCDKFHSKTKS